MASPSETAAASPSADPSPAAPLEACEAEQPSATGAPVPSGSAASLAVGALEPGRYTTNRFEPRVALTLGTGWRELFDDEDDEVALERDGGGFLGITRVNNVVSPETSRIEDAPDDLFAWLLGHDSLDVECGGPVTVAGLSGHMLEAAVTAGRDVFAYDEGNMRVVAGDRIRYYVLDLDGPELTIVAAAGSAVFDDWIGDVQAIVDSIELTP